MPVDGKGKKGVLIVAEAPGWNEDQQGKPLVGRSGQLLESALEEFGIDMREDCWLTNAIICRSFEGESNRTPTDKEIEWCRPNLVKTIKELNPRAIIPLGGPAVKSLLGWLWRNNVGAISKWVGWRIPNQQLNSWICPTFHPSFVMRQDNDIAVKELLFKRHLKAAFKLKGRPWKVVPNFKGQVKVELDPDRAAETIDWFTNGQNLPVAIDYETDRLKPDNSERRIVACSLSNGAVTLSYPWTGRAIQSTKNFLISRIPKIASNLKFEQRWTMKVLGCKVKNWLWDTMLAAHTLDNRREISGIEFQSFVLLGQPPWDHYVEPYMKSSNSNKENRLKEVNLNQLLVYNGLDALLEWHVARKQMKRMGYE